LEMSLEFSSFRLKISMVRFHLLYTLETVKSRRFLFFGIYHEAFYGV
jgi:hypothetical protein